NFSQSAMCCGMKRSSRTIPPASVASLDRRVTTDVVSPAATVASAPTTRRAIIIGRVNDIAAATLAYAGHAARMIRPAMVATPTHTARPATTPRIRLAMRKTLEGSVATRLVKIGHTPGGDITRCRAGHSRHVERQMSLVEISRVSCDRRARAVRRLLDLLQCRLEADDAAEDLRTVADPGMHQPVQMALA